MERGQGSVSSGGRHRHVPPMELLAPSPTCRGSHDALLPGLSHTPAALPQVPLLKGYSHSKATSSQLNTYLIIIRLGQLPKRDRMLQSALGKAPEKHVSRGPAGVTCLHTGPGRVSTASLCKGRLGVPGSPPALAMPHLVQRGYSA